MNVDRGYKRLVIGVIGLWVLLWLTMGGFALYQQGIWADIFIEASRANRLSEMGLADQWSNYWASWVKTALTALVGTIPLAIVLLTIRWIVRGFTKDA